jgi:hypothetical protein
MSCATTYRALPEKYNLDGELEAVSQISIFDVSVFENIDGQSIILKADHMSYYLLVLRRPIAIKYPDPSIVFENAPSEKGPLSIMDENEASKNRLFSSKKKMGSRLITAPTPKDRYVGEVPSKIKVIASGDGRIIVAEKTGAKKYYVIEKIYKLKGKEQAEKIKKRLSRTRRQGSGLYI